MMTVDRIPFPRTGPLCRTATNGYSAIILDRIFHWPPGRIVAFSFHHNLPRSCYLAVACS